MTSKAKQIAARLALLLAIALVAPACTKNRDPKFSEEESEAIYPKELFTNSEVTILASGQPSVIERGQALRAEGEAPLVKAQAMDAPPQLEPLFQGIQIHGTPGSAYKVRFQLDKLYITAVKVVKDENELTTVESQIATRVLRGNIPEILVPIFQVRVAGYGVVQRRKNDLGEDTDDLRLKPTEFEQATHINAGLFASARVAVDIPAAAKEEAKRVFLKDRIASNVMTGKELQELMNVGLAMAPETNFLLQVSGKDLHFFEVTSLDSTTLSDAEREVIRQIDNGATGDGTIARCPKTMEAKIPANVNRENCIIVQRYSLRLRFVVASRGKESDDIPSSGIEYREPLNPQDTRLVYIPLNPQVVEVNPVDQINILDPAKAIEVAQVKGQEYLFRRTLEDSPNGFDYTFAGASGEMEIVKFEFEKERVKILRADPLVRGDGSTVVDREILLSLPAKYVKKVLVDETGQPLSRPRFVQAPHTDAQAIALVDWANNAIPNVLSPLNYYALEQCFTGASERTVSNVDQRLANGQLSFSLDSTYASNPSIDCTGIAQADYFDTIQTNFTFRERVSFKKYLKKNDEKPLMDVPYDAQKKLGFGLFTYSKKVPDRFGNVGVDGTEIPLAAVFDVGKEKQITYVLAGIPAAGAERERIIQATREVIADWNKAFERAFAGTPLEGRKEVLKLAIEGEDSAPARLGDLDRNYLYYVQKRTQSPIIGLGGAHSNPRTGEVEAASSFIYGGNIWTVVDSIRRVEETRALYDAIMGDTMAAAQPEGGAEDGNADGGGEAPADGSLRPAGRGLGNVASAGNGIAQKPKPHAKVTLGEAIVRAGVKVDLPKKLAMSAAKAAGMRGYGENLTRLGLESSQEKLETLKRNPRNRNALRFYEAMRAVAAKGKLGSSQIVEAAMNEAILDVRGSALSERAWKKLKARTNRAKAMAKVMDNMRAKDICMFEADESTILRANPDKDATDLDLLVAIYKPTLAHEIGHNLGLRHNFIATFDKANHRHDEADGSKRNYSSVMDYNPDDHETYDGAGPQDVAALRAAYAGLLELAPEVQQVIRDQNIADIGGLPIISGKFMKVNDYPKALGIQSWLQLRTVDMQALPLKPYKFCSDEEAGLFPSCNRFDSGSTPAEIVQNVARDHRSLYGLRNFPGDRLRFGDEELGSYIGRLFSRLIPIRQFLEETIYLAITGADGEAINSHAQGAFETMLLLHEIIRSPDAVAGAPDMARFAVSQDDKGKMIIVERKVLQDVGFDDNQDRIAVRGVEFDKIIALLMLTERDLGFPRYERASLRFSFPEFERLVFGDQIESPLQLPTVGLLTEVLANRITPMAPSGAGAVQLDSTFKTETTETIRFYGVLGAIASLDVDGLEAADNNSALFRIMSGLTVPKKREFVMKPGVTDANVSELRYWAFDDAPGADQLIAKQAALGAFNKAKPAIAKVMEKWVREKLGVNAPADANPAGDTVGDGEAKVEASARPDAPPTPPAPTLDEELAKALKNVPEGLGPKDPKAIAAFLGQVINFAKQVQENGDAVLPVDQFNTLLQNIGTDAPILGLAMSQIPGSEIQLPILDGVVGANDSDFNELSLFRNTQTVNSLFYLLHPEYAR